MIAVVVAVALIVFSIGDFHMLSVIDNAIDHVLDMSAFCWCYYCSLYSHQNLFFRNIQPFCVFVPVDL
uniref:Putative secreted protein n=1 Tax=Panstrongylus lignarius TaxID=156445 RepID=A0A224Y6K1_9HEMI